MKAAIGMIRPPKGGFGNRVLTYLSLRAISARLGCPYFSQNKIDRGLVEGIHRGLFPPLLLRRNLTVPNSELLDENFLMLAQGHLAAGESLVIRGALLGEVFVRYGGSIEHSLPEHHFSLCRTHRNVHEGEKVSVIHMRGGDFHEWDSSAVLDADYYLRAIEERLGGSPDERFRICTDDTELDSVAEVSKFLISKDRIVGPVNCEDSFGCDFAAMAEARVLISSPSTFAIAAGLLGNAQVIHDSRWVQNRIERGEKFWLEVSKNSLPGYNVISLI